MAYAQNDDFHSSASNGDGSTAAISTARAAAPEGLSGLNQTKNSSEADQEDFFASQKEEVNYFASQTPEVADDGDDGDNGDDADDPPYLTFECASAPGQTFKVSIVSPDSNEWVARPTLSIGTGITSPVDIVIRDQARANAKNFSLVSSQTAGLKQHLSGFELFVVGRHGMLITRGTTCSTLETSGKTKMMLEHGDVVQFGFERAGGKVVCTDFSFTVIFPGGSTWGNGRRGNKKKQKLAAQQKATEEEDAKVQQAATLRHPEVAAFAAEVTEVANSLIARVDQAKTQRGARALVGQARQALANVVAAMSTQGETSRASKRERDPIEMKAKKAARVASGVARRGEELQRVMAARQHNRSAPAQVAHARKMQAVKASGKGGKGKGGKGGKVKGGSWISGGGSGFGGKGSKGDGGSWASGGGSGGGSGFGGKGSKGGGGSWASGGGRGFGVGCTQSCGKGAKSGKGKGGSAPTFEITLPPTFACTVPGVN